MERHDRIFAVAVASRRLAMAFLNEGELQDWHLWHDLTVEPTTARSELRMRIARLKPNLLVVEDPDRQYRKGEASLKLLRLIAQDFADQPIRSIKVMRVWRYPNRYKEAVALSRQFPAIERFCPKRWNSFDSAPKQLTYFQAVAHALEARRWVAAGEPGGRPDKR